MGLMVDSNVFIKFEKSGTPIDLSHWEASAEVYISAVTASELLAGVHRANTEERRQRRSAFVESIISTIPIIDFTLDVARIHARVHAALAAKGILIGAHDLLIAASALHANLTLLTDNVSEFTRIPDLHIIPFTNQAGT